MMYVCFFVYSVAVQLVPKESSSGERRIVGITMFAAFIMPAVFALLQTARRLYSGAWPVAETAVVLGRKVPGQVSIIALAAALLISVAAFYSRHEFVMGQFQSMKVPTGRIARIAIASCLFAFVLAMLFLGRLDPRATLAAYVAVATSLSWYLKCSGLRARWAGPSG